MTMPRNEPEYSDEEAAKRAEEAIRRSFATPHKPRKVIAPATTRGDAQRKRRAKGSPKSR
jgi:hypothetical protein